MTPAEFKTARERLRLDGRYMAELLCVSYDTVRRWESRGHIPPGVEAEIDDLEATIDSRVTAALDSVAQITAAAGDLPEAITLIRYRHPDDADHHLGDREEALIHTAIVTRVFEGLRKQGHQARLVMMDTHTFEAWCAAHNMVPDEAARAEWGGLQLV